MRLFIGVELVLGRKRKPPEEIMKTISINLKQKIIDNITGDIPEEEKRITAKRKIEEIITKMYS